MFKELFTPQLLRATIRMTTPIILAALGGLLTYKAGIFNIAMEGMILVGAFSAVVGGYFLGNCWLGVIVAILAVLLLSAIYGFFVVKLKSNEFIIGIAINIFANGITVYLLRAIFGVKGAFSSPEIPGLPDVSFPLLDKIGILNTILNNHSIFIYLSWLFVLLIYILIYKTPLGIRIRAAGEYPEALETAGVSVSIIKYITIILNGILCGFAGAHLSLGYLTLFTEGMSDGRGWIAVAAVIFGDGNPVVTFAITSLFGFTDGLAFLLQGLGIPDRFARIVPHFTVIFALFIVARRAVLKIARKKREVIRKET
ncbi:unnamed protein product [marine sediment metagenome]|uniref:ABC transporter permease n=1 Tax=marine sediment metagenome TaxID=412755 RepID=X1S057_9ZZZZ